MNILVINGNPKRGGFTEEVLDMASSYLKEKGAETETIRLADAYIQDCIGCFNCLRTGKCVLEDDTENIIQKMKEADGFVIGSPVRNGLPTACYKRFCERITYTLGFPLALENKYTVAIASVGFMGGRSVSRRMNGLQGVFHTRLSGFIFCPVGIPAKVKAADIKERLEKKLDHLVEDIDDLRPRPLIDRISFLLDRIVLRKFMFEKHPDVYANVIQNWVTKGYMSDTRMK